MDRQANLLNLADGLSRAAAKRDWEALAQVDGLVATGLAQMAAQGPLTPGERRALEKLRGAHRDAYQHCARELGLVRDQMEEMRASHAGWCAYAESGELEESQA